jgi:hypothetical protein
LRGLLSPLQLGSGIEHEGGDVYFGTDPRILRVLGELRAEGVCPCQLSLLLYLDLLVDDSLPNHVPVGEVSRVSTGARMSSCGDCRAARPPEILLCLLVKLGLVVEATPQQVLVSQIEISWVVLHYI